MKCNKCRKVTSHPAKIRHEVDVNGARFVGTLSGFRCASCKETEIPLDELAKLEHAVARYLAEHGPVSGATMRYMRKSIPMSASQLADMLRVARETVSRWETGDREVDRAAWFFVRNLLLNPSDRSQIAALRDAPSSRVVSIEA
jgi:DNA-binding transcriptional regulator YiaG